MHELQWSVFNVHKYVTFNHMTLLKTASDYATHKLDPHCVSSTMLLVTSTAVYW
jgi:hypothetical protein